MTLKLWHCPLTASRLQGLARWSTPETFLLTLFEFLMILLPLICGHRSLFISQCQPWGGESKCFKGGHRYNRPDDRTVPRTQTKTNSVALSPQANYTDWATATCRRNLVPTFVDRGVWPGQRGESPTVVNVSLLDRVPRTLQALNSREHGA
jgi:hypothetical protein